jgi:hypothetical protein
MLVRSRGMVFVSRGVVASGLRNCNRIENKRLFGRADLAKSGCHPDYLQPIAIPKPAFTPARDWRKMKSASLSRF